jgi:hypothetical protein
LGVEGWRPEDFLPSLNFLFPTFYMARLIFFCFLLISASLRAQEPVRYDSIPYMDEVYVSAFGQNGTKQKFPLQSP